jgi:hypothetical protein
MPSIEFYLDRILEKAPPHVVAMVADAKRRVEIATFGEGFKRDRHGKPRRQVTK